MKFRFAPKSELMLAMLQNALSDVKGEVEANGHQRPGTRGHREENFEGDFIYWGHRVSRKSRNQFIYVHNNLRHDIDNTLLSSLAPECLVDRFRPGKNLPSDS
jgi:hypothetical protein